MFSTAFHIHVTRAADMEIRTLSPEALYLPSYVDILRWPDFTLIAWRKEARAELDRAPNPALQRRYDASTQEIANRNQASLGGSWGAEPIIRRAS
jgi:hypothetical protein